MFSRLLARCTTIGYLAWLSLAVGLPWAFGSDPLPLPRYECPWPTTVHGVGSDLRSYVKSVDLCHPDEARRRVAHLRVLVRNHGDMVQ